MYAVIKYKTDGGQLTPSKLLDRVPVIDVVEVSCAQHTAAAVAPLRIKSSAYDYRPANHRSMSKRVHTQTGADSVTIATTLLHCKGTRLCRPKDEATEENVDH